MVRRSVGMVLVVVTALLVAASCVAVWAHRTVLDTDDFMDAVGPALDDPAFSDALADTLTEQTLLALDLDARVSNRLIELDEVLTLTLVDRLEARVETVVDRFVASQAFRDRMPSFVERAHRAAIGIARGDADEHPEVYLTDDALVLDTAPLVAEAVREALGSIGDMLPGITLPDAVARDGPEARAHLSAMLGAQLPEGFGEVVLLDRETFDLLQGTVTAVDRAVWVLVAVTMLLIVVTVLITPDRRRGTVQLGTGTVVSLVVAAALVARLRGPVVDVARTPDGERVAEVLFDSAVTSLHEILWLVGAVAAVAAVVGVMLGRPAWLERAGEHRPWVRAVTGQDGRLPHRVAEHADAVRVVALALAVLVVVLTGFSWVAIVLAVLFLVVCLVCVSVAQRIADVPGSRRSTPT